MVCFVGMGRRGAVLVTVILLVSCSEVLSAQGFRLLNGRNHPELDWRVATTEHFEIAFPSHLEGIEAEAAAVAEETYRVLSANLGVTFDRPIRIYLSDEDEIANGIAVPLGNGYTTIWVHANETALLFTGHEKWLRKVLAHELAHIFHYRATRSRLGLFSYLLGNPRPSFWTEGLAQYLTEDWDAMRGERWLRTAVLDDALSYSDGKSAWNGRLLYAVGHSQVRWFAEQYGDSTLARMLAHRKPALFGLAHVHDFGAAFRATTGQPYKAFREDWRRDLNVYYNSLAGQLESPDSLRGEEVPYQGALVSDFKGYGRGARSAALTTHSIDRPVAVLYVEEPDASHRRTLAEGSLRGPVSWSADGDRIAFGRRIRNRVGSWINDLFLVEVATGRTRRLTVDRRAAYPSFAPRGARLAFVSSSAGTSNVFVCDVATGVEEQVTFFEGDVQITGLAWHPVDDVLALTLFDADGARRLATLDLRSGVITDLSDGTIDYRDPAWSPDGARLAVTSLEDGVPNVFVFEGITGSARRDSVSIRRVTALVSGAAVMAWQVFGDGRDGLVLKVTESKQRDRVFRIDADRTPAAGAADRPSRKVPGWMTRRPPNEVSRRIEADPGLIRLRRPYASWSQVDRIFSLVLPYALGAGEWGLFGGSGWADPLGKHLLAAYGNVSLADPLAGTSLVIQYANSTFHPTILLTGHRFPASARPYGGHLLLERMTGVQVDVYRPLDLALGSYTNAQLGFRLAYGLREPIHWEAFEDLPDDLARPETAKQVLGMVSARLKTRPPDRNDVIHPLSGHGVLLRLTVAGNAETRVDRVEYARADLLGYRLFGGPGATRFYLYGRFESQFGSSLAQDFVGLSRVDDISFVTPLLGSTYFLGHAERVRGYRRYLLGQHVAFGTVEYRVPLLRDLDTRLLGAMKLGRTTFALFTDAGAVWRNRLASGELTGRVGTGIELKNLLRFGSFDLLHAVGAARPAGSFFTGTTDFYYRVRASFPF